MRSRLSVYLSMVVLAAGWLAGHDHLSASQSAAPQSSREEAYRANNIGVALLEQFNYKEAAVQFRQALKLEPSLGLARVNLGIALYNLPDPEGALRELKAASDVLPSSPQAHYVLGLIARSQNRTPDGITAFQRVLQIDPGDPSANINLGQLYMQQRKYPEAIAAFRAAVGNEPYNVTATYNLAMALTRSGERQEGQAMMQKFQVLRTKGYATTLGQSYLEQGRYAEAIASTGTEPGLVDPTKPDVRFTDATSTVLAKAGEAERAYSRSPLGQSYKAGEINDQVKRQIVGTLAGCELPLDFDGDGDMDLFQAGVRGLTLFRNDGGKLVDVTDQSGLPRSASNAVTAVGGDYDNDLRPDIVLINYGGLKLYHNDGDGKFSDRTAGADLPAYPHLAISAALVDVDHDGDLDIFVAGLVDLIKQVSGNPDRVLVFPNDFPGAPNLLVRNNGEGKFTDITAAAMVAGNGGHAIAVTPTDFDNHRDVDLLVANYDAAPTLFSNQRDGTFRDVAGEVGLNIRGGVTSVAASDINKDDYTDFFFGKADGPGVFAISDGKGRFVTSSAPSGSEGPIAAQFLDYDNDGLRDLVLLQNQAVRILRNLGTKWDDVTERSASADLLKSPGASSHPPARGFASVDFDGDRDTDLIVFLASGDLKIARNDGGHRNQSLRVQLTGRVSNRSAVGTKIEARAGSLKQKLETYAANPAPAPADVIFGLGKRDVADAVRLLWPAGIVQAETDFSSAKSGVLKVTEVDRKPSSCPYLYTWNGELFEFVTDFMGGGEMGYWQAPGVRNHPDPDEYVRIRDDQLKARNGRYELRVTNELEEALYVDRLQLIAIDHPADTEVYPNEGMTHLPRAFKLFTTRSARPPRSAVDDHGHDVTAKIAKLDRQYPDDFKVNKIRGYAEKHTLSLDLGEPTQQRTLLLLTGWTDYAFSSDNVAASHGGLSLSPPELQVKDSQGRWQTVIADIGIPVGRPQTIVLDLTGKVPTRAREVQIVTNMRIYWDQILVDTSEVDLRLQMTRLDPLSAVLRWRGFSAEVSPDGREPFSYDYSQVSLISPWKTMPGRYTREGDVEELVWRSDDMFVISKPGDEIALAFDATKLRALPQGWKRTFLLYADGFSKEMDINSASPDQVTPLPFHAMKSYPYSEKESYPMTRIRRAYYERYNTRLVRAELPSIDGMLAGGSRESGASSKQR